MKIALFLIAAALAAALPMPGAQAQSTTTFGQYSVSSTSGNVYTFTNAAAGSGLTLVTASIPVTFIYNVSNGYDATGGTNIAATLTFSEFVSGTATSVSLGGPLTFLYQPVGTVNLALTANAPVGGKTNLLTLSNSTGSISGLQSGNTASNTGDTATGNTVNFTSDFLSFAGSTARNYNIALTSVTPILGKNANGYLNSFTAQGNGSFAYTPAPEPNALVSLAVMGGSLALCIAVRRRAVRA